LPKDATVSRQLWRKVKFGNRELVSVEDIRQRLVKDTEKITTVIETARSSQQSGGISEEPTFVPFYEMERLKQELEKREKMLAKHNIALMESANENRLLKREKGERLNKLDNMMDDFGSQRNVVYSDGPLYERSRRKKAFYGFVADSQDEQLR
jgi:hypothetical protein